MADSAHGDRGANHFLLASGRQHQLRPRDRTRATPNAKLAVFDRVLNRGSAGGLLANASRIAAILPTPARCTDIFPCMIRKVKSGEYRLYSRKKSTKTGKRRNLGTFSSRAAAEKHERAVQFFKKN
jgi:hypothetical protein